MKRLSSGKIGIAQGSKVLFSDFADGGAMWTGELCLILGDAA